MAVLVHEISGPDLLSEQVGSGFRAEVYSELAAVEAIWRGLETSPDRHGSPYQRFDWVAAYVEAEAGGDAARLAQMLRVVVLRDADNRCRLLLPFLVTRAFGLRVARVVGERHANLHLPLFASREAASMRPEDLAAALVQAGRRHGIDLFSLDSQPRLWHGAPNPLAVGGERCASDAYELTLGPDAETTLKRIYGGDTRKKMRAKARRLAELVGPIEHRIADTPERAAAILDAFHAQKHVRLVRIGARNPYARATIQDFIARASRPSRPADPAAIEIHALVAVRTGRILATFGGAVDETRFSGMWTSFDPDPEIGRFSPGDLLLGYLIAWQAGAGRRVLDLGVGEARYKANICDRTIELVKTVIPVTPAGRVYGLGALAALRIKRRAKASPFLCRTVRRLRRLQRA